MSDTLVCPDCGHDEFVQVRTTRTRFTLQFIGSAGCPQEVELSSELDDAGERDEDIECTGCEARWNLDAPELVTEAEYSEAEDDE